MSNMRLRSSPLVLALVACSATGTMALTSTTAFASSGHSSHGSTKVSVKGNDNCTIVNSKNVHCTTVSRSHRHGHGDEFGRHHGGIVEGVGDILGGLLGAL
jgi:hypothetical protein